MPENDEALALARDLKRLEDKLDGTSTGIADLAAKIEAIRERLATAAAKESEDDSNDFFL